MKIHMKILLVLMLIVLVNIISACQTNPPSDRTEPAANTSIIGQSPSYALLTDEEEVKTSAAIFMGKVVSLSPTTWNQDNGEAWDNEGSSIATLQLHTVDIQVEQKIIDTLGLGDTITVTSLGTSPAEEFADYHLGVGDEALLFVKKAKIAWREGGTKEVILYTGSPLQSIYVKNYEGQYALLDDTEVLSLDELVAKISSLRSDVLK